MSAAYNAKALKSDFTKLATSVKTVADKSVASVLSTQDAFEMTFDETESIPITAPTAGTIVFTGLSDMDATGIEAMITGVAKEKLSQLEAHISSQLKEVT